jgi:hypothetical protein
MTDETRTPPAGSVPLPTPTPRPELRERFADLFPLGTLPHPEEILNAVMPVVDELLDQGHDLLTRVAMKGAEASLARDEARRELATTREERDEAVKIAEDRGLELGLLRYCMTRPLAGVEAARQLRAEWAPDLSKAETAEEYGYRQAFERVCDWLEFEFKPRVSPAVPEDPATPTPEGWRPTDGEVVEKNDYPSGWVRVQIDKVREDRATYDQLGSNFSGCARLHLFRPLPASPSLPEEVQP